AVTQRGSLVRYVGGRRFSEPALVGRRGAEREPRRTALGQCEPLDTRLTLESSIWFDPPPEYRAAKAIVRIVTATIEPTKTFAFSHPSKSRGFVRYLRKRSCLMTASQ